MFVSTSQAGSLFPQFISPSSARCMRRHSPLRVSPSCLVDTVIVISLKRAFSNLSEAEVCWPRCWETSWEDERKSVQRDGCAQVRHGELGSLLGLLMEAWVTQRQLSHPRVCCSLWRLQSLSPLCSTDVSFLQQSS